MKISTESRDIIRANNMIEIAEMVEKAVARQRPADRELRRIFRQNRGFGSHDRRLYGDAVFSLFRWLGWTGSLADNGPAALLRAMLLDADSITPAIAALANIAEFETSALPPMGTLSLEEKAAHLVESGLSASAPELRLIVPDWVMDKLPFSSEDMLSSWLESLQQPLPVWLRAAQGRESEAEKYLEANGVEIGRHEQVISAFTAEKNVSRELLEKAPARLLEIQDLASQCVGLVCDPKPGDHWWDVCAGAGGKSLQLSDLIGEAGEILATDVNPERLKELKRRSRKAGIRNIGIRSIPKSDADQTTASYDGVLVDAPCSGTGTWARNPDARWRTSAGYVAKCAERQAQLLRNASAIVRPGGKLIYAVCSLLKDETTDIAEQFLADTQGFRPDAFINPLSGEETDGYLFVQPWSFRSIGMYIAKFVRQE